MLTVPLGASKGIPPAARAAVRKAGEHWPRFLQIWNSMMAFDADPIIEDFGPFYAQFRLLQRLGVPFDQSFIAAVDHLALTCRDTAEDPDADDADWHITDADSDDEDEQTGVAFAQANPWYFHPELCR